MDLASQSQKCSKRIINMPFASIESAVADIRDGRMIIIVDDEDRENEGDLVCAAEKVTPEIINFMARHARGLICLPLTEERCDELHLTTQVAESRPESQLPIGPRRSWSPSIHNLVRGTSRVQVTSSLCARRAAAFLSVPDRRKRALTWRVSRVFIRPE